MTMESLDPFGEAPNNWVNGARISFSHDLDMHGRSSPEKRKREIVAEEEDNVDDDDDDDDDDGDEDCGHVMNNFSFEFEFAHSIALDLPSQNRMLSADELFSNGKLRPLGKCSYTEQSRDQLQQTLSGRIVAMATDEGGEADGTGAAPPWPMVGHLRRLNENPRCLSMTFEDSRGHPHRSCISLNNSRCSSPSRSLSFPPTTPSSPKASTSRYSRKLKDFFRLRKLHVPVSKEVPTSSTMSGSLAMSPSSIPALSSSTSSSAAISRENSVSSSCRLPISTRSFWPFSRSNSAGENKNGCAVSPPPRRSNSAGESKTSSSALLPSSTRGIAPNIAKSSKAVPFPSSSIRANGATDVAKGIKAAPMASGSKFEAIRFNQQSKKGLPPVNYATVKKAVGSHSFRVPPAHCGTDAVALSSQSTASVYAPTHVLTSSVGSLDSASCSQGNGVDHPHAKCEVCPSVAGTNYSGSTRMLVRKGASSSGARNFARSSPSRGGSWNSPRRGPTRTLRRANAAPKALVGPKDMLARDTASVRITPILNVPACMTPSLRGTKVTSRTKLFSLGNLFSKKGKAAGVYSVLPPCDSQNGG